MVIQEEPAVVPQQTQPPANIDNIMSGIENTGTVRMNNHRKKLRQRFDIIKKLGQGTYGKVQLGINKETGQEVAIKTIKKCKIETEADLIRIRREVQIMSSVQHPNIIHIYEVFENREKMVLVMEFAAGGELYDYLSERKVLSEEEARRVFRQISTAVYYCHKHKICHRDLKLENILLDEHGSAKIADFGLSNVFDEHRLLSTFCGSPLYASPEIVKGTPYQGPEADCWSLGVLLYTLVYGAMPFDGSNFKRLVKQISQGDYYEPRNASPASPLIREMLTVCPKQRANIETICSHWWVNEGYDESCLDLAEELANQTPVRLDVLLSLAPPAVTADQLVVPTPGVQESKSTDRVARSHSVGSVIDLTNTEAEQRIIDMVTQGGEAALMPSPTRIMTPAESPAQAKRKLEQTVSTENATGVIKKKEKASVDPLNMSKRSIPEQMEVELSQAPIPAPQQLADITQVENICDELIAGGGKPTPKKVVVKKKVPASTENKAPEPVKPAATETSKPDENIAAPIPEPKSSSPSKPSAADTRRKSRIFETAEKFQNMNNANTEKAKKFGATVGNFKKEFERKASMTGTNLPERIAAPTEKKTTMTTPLSPPQDYKSARKTSLDDSKYAGDENMVPTGPKALDKTIEQQNKLSDSKSSITSFSLEEARRSMENSIALLNQARNESNKELDQLCAKTENVSMSDIPMNTAVPGNNFIEREKKLKAREIIGNAIPTGRHCMGVRKPPVPFGINGRSISGSVIPSNTGYEKKPLRVQLGGPENMATAIYSVSTPENKMYPDPFADQRPLAVAKLIEKLPHELPETTKTSRAEITLKSATLPRRKPAKTDMKVDIEPKSERGMRFSTEMQHQIPDLRSAPIREHPYSPTTAQPRATSLEPKELIIPVQRPPAYQKASSTSVRSGTLSRQSTNESDTDTTIQSSSIGSMSTLGGATSSSQPIKKSPREFIIPIAVEGGGFLTPRAGSLEPSDSASTSATLKSAASNTAFGKLGRPRRIGSLLSDKDAEDDSPFQKLHRHTSISRDSDNEEPRFHTMHRLRSTRPMKRVVNADPNNDSASSGEDDDDDGFEILTAENLFSTLLSRVRDLTNRLNVNDTHGFPSSRLMSNFRQPHSSFWNHDPFNSNLNKSSSSWRHSISRDLGSDFDSMFSRSGATLPRGTKFKSNPNSNTPSSASSSEHNNTNTTTANSTNADNNTSEKLDLRDLDLSRLRLTKKDLETLSSITPNLPKQVQEQLIAQLPPNQARKLCRTLSMQNGTTELNSTTTTTQKPYKRSLSGGRDLSDSPSSYSNRSSGVFATAAATSDRNSTYRRSLSKTRYDNNEKTSRSSSRCRDSICDTDDSSNAYLNDLAKYRSFNRDYERSNSESTTHTSSDYYNNLPPVPGCISPPPLPGDITLRRRSAPKRISRFLRPDFYDTPREDSIYVSKDNKDRDSESRRILKEIRERSRERSADRNGTSSDRLNYIMEKYAKKGDDSSKYSRHSSVEGFTNDSRDSLVDYDKRRQSFSKSKDPSLSNIADKINFADKILNELQNIAKIQKEEVVATTAAAAGATTTTQKDENNEKIENVEDLTPDKKTDKKETKIIKVKKVKSRDKLADSLASNSPPAKVNDINMVTNLTKEIDSISPLNVATSKVKESKLMRPKSYPNKDKTTVKKSGDETGAVDDKKTATTDTSESTSTDGNKSTRPKSFPNSKLTPPKDVKKTDSPPNEKSSSVTTKSKLADKEKSGDKEKTANGQTKTVKKVIKTVKKTIKNNSTAAPEGLEKTETTKEKVGNDIKEASPPKQLAKEVSPEKKVNKGFLYSIGQKFEKFRENTKTKEKKTAAATKDNVTKDNKDAAPIISTPINSTPIENSVDDLKKKKTKAATDETKSKKVTTAAITAPIIAADKKSKIDSMIRNLREKSVPRSPVMSESRLLKRATSVEDISGGYNKCGVNKVLGLFKKYEKDQQNTSKLKNTKSTSHVETDVDSDGTPTVTVTLPRPKSIIETNSSTAPRKNAYKGTQSDSILTISEQMAAKQQQQNSKIPKFGCNECNTYENESVTKRHSTAEAQNLCNEEKEMMKNKRKGLMLDFTKLDSPSPSQLQSQNHNGVLQSDTNSNNIPPLVNNNCIYPSSSHDINRNTNSNHSYESLTNYSSDLRSPYDDGASTSTVFSPNSEDHELMFDNWSVCSDDHTYPTPSPSTSHYSRSSHIIPSPLLENASSESIVDRIRRKSFYTRFNEKKPKRVSTIVGPGAKEYNPRESSVTRSASKPLEYKRSATSSTDHTKNTHEYYRPLKTNTFDNVYNLTTSSSAMDSKPKSSYHLPPTTSSITKHHHHHPSFDHTDYKFLSSTTSPSEYISSGSYKKSSEHLFPPTTSKRTTMYDPQHLPLPPSTYNSRSTPTSSYLNGTTSSTNLETYATLGRKIRPYEQRSLSLMNSLNSTRSGIASSSNAGSKLGSSSSGLGIGNSSSTYNREQRVTPDYGSLSRSNIRTRTPSVSKGSTNA